MQRQKLRLLTRSDDHPRMIDQGLGEKGRIFHTSGTHPPSVQSMQSVSQQRPLQTLAKETETEEEKKKKPFRQVNYLISVSETPSNQIRSRSPLLRVSMCLSLPPFLASSILLPTHTQARRSQDRSHTFFSFSVLPHLGFGLNNGLLFARIVR